MRWQLLGATAVGLACALAGVSATDESSELLPPVRLQADGRDIDTGDAWGHSGPTMADINGDGKRDLVVGDFSGKFRMFRNIGSNSEPNFGPQSFLMAGGEEAKVWIYCCIGSSPFFVDYDGDGNFDMISGSYDPGECYLFRGLGDGEFAARETIVSADGKPVLRVPDQRQSYESFGSWPAMVDWDDDGDLDLVVGGFDGTVFVRLNEGTRTQPLLAATNLQVMCGDKPLTVPDRHAAISIADWDGDGRWDILSGSELGAVYWYRNTGTAEAPEFETERVLIPKAYGDDYIELDEADAPPRRGVRTQVFATDYNQDGKVDLLVGDFRTSKTLRAGLTAEDRAQVDEIQERLKSLRDERRTALADLQKSFDEKYPGERATSDEATAEWTKSYTAFRESAAMKGREAEIEVLNRSLQTFVSKPEAAGKFDDYETTHGYVWLYLRK
jgi:hypothetical protein